MGGLGFGVCTRKMERKMETTIGIGSSGGKDLLLVYVMEGLLVYIRVVLFPTFSVGF